MEQFIPAEDGSTHINIYSKGKTQLGRDLSNFAYKPIDIPDYGVFVSIEGFWYYRKAELLLRKWNDKEQQQIDSLCGLSGYNAKKVGTELLKGIRNEDWYCFNTEAFKESIKNALRLKIHNYYDLQSQLAELPIPLAHYYTYGSVDKYVVRDAGNPWITEYLNTLRIELITSAAELYIVRIHVEGFEDCKHAFTLTGGTKHKQLDDFISLLKLIKDKKMVWNVVTEEELVDFVAGSSLDKDRKEALFFIQSNLLTTENGEYCFAELSSVKVVQQNGIEVLNYE